MKTPVDYSHEVRVSGSRVVRALFLALGILFSGLGIAGIFLPLVPTTPFLLVAAACYARSSTRLYNRLLNHPVVGSVIREWRQHRRMPRRAKWAALAVVPPVFGLSVARYAGEPRIWIPLVLIGVGLLVFLARIPSHD